MPAPYGSCLQVLIIRDSSASAAQLQQLSAALTSPCGSLRKVSLGYGSFKAAVAAAAGWPALPMAALDMRLPPSWYVSEEPPPGIEPVLEAVGQLTQLSSLTMRQGHMDATPQQLAAALAGLSNLQVSRGCGFDWSSSS